MLEGIDDVDWARLRGVYGPATDVPGQIRALVTATREERHRILNELVPNLVHQETIWEATPHTVPFFIEIALDPATDDELRATLVRLLAELATSVSSPEYAATVGLPVDADEVARGRGWVDACRAATREALPKLAADLDPDVARARRAAAVYLASQFPEEAALLVPRLRALRDAESDERIRRACTLTLALLGAEPREEIARIVREVDDEADEDAVLGVMDELLFWNADA